MPSEHVQKLVAGSLLLSASLVSGNAALVTTVGGIGINWTSEGISGLWQEIMASRAGTPLRRAYEHAIRSAVSNLRQQYVQQFGKRRDLSAFDLLLECATSIARTDASIKVESELEILQLLEQTLDDLLFGHDIEQTRWIKQHLLNEVAQAFHKELLVDTAAWQQFHGWFIQYMAQDLRSLRSSVEQSSETLNRLTDPDTFKQILSDSTSHIQEQLDRLYSNVQLLIREAQQNSSHSSVFDNRGMHVGRMTQIAGNAYYNSTHISGTSSSVPISNNPPREFNLAKGQTVLALLRDEIDDNLGLLQTLLDEPDTIVKPSPLNDRVGELPSWDRQIWLTSLPTLDKFLEAESIRQVRRFYKQLEDLQRLPQPHIDHGTQKYYVTLSDELHDALRKLINQGNPLQQA